MIKYNKHSVTLDIDTYFALRNAAVETLSRLQINDDTKNDEFSCYFSSIEDDFILAVRKDDVRLLSHLIY